MGMKLDAPVATNALDSSGEILSIKGLDITDFLEGRAMANWEHSNTSEDGAVGRFVYAKKIFSEADCENERQLAFWKQLKHEFLYGVVELFDDEGHPGATAIAAMVRYFLKRGEKIRIGMSIEGSTLERDGHLLQRAVARKAAITLTPCNKECWVEFFHDEMPISKTESVEVMDFEPLVKVKQLGLVPEMDKEIHTSADTDTYGIPKSLLPPNNAARNRKGKLMYSEAENFQNNWALAGGKYIDQGLKHGNADVRYAAIKHPKATEDHISQALTGNDEDVSEAAMYHPNFNPSKHLPLALKSYNINTIKAALEHPDLDKETFNNYIEHVTNPEYGDDANPFDIDAHDNFYGHEVNSGGLVDQIINHKFIEPRHIDGLQNQYADAESSDLGDERHYDGESQSIFQDARDLHAPNDEQVHVRFGTAKLRQLRDVLDKYHGGKINSKVLAEKGMDINQAGLSHLKDAQGNIDSKRVQEAIDKMPSKAYGITRTKWGGAQRHNDKDSFVYQVNLTKDMIDEMKNKGVYDHYRKIADASRQSSHPVKNHTIGWVRGTVGKDKNIHIDEIQSDFGQSILKQGQSDLKRQLNDGDIDESEYKVKLDNLAKEYPEEAHKQIKDIIFGNKHPSEVLHEAFHEGIRKKGTHVGRKISIWGKKGRAQLSNMDTDRKLPGHIEEGYEDIPKKMGYTQGSYGPHNIADQDNDEHFGKDVWNNIVRKEELIAELEAFKKTMTAGGLNVAPSILTGNAALTRADIGIRKKLKEVLNKWDRKTPVRAVIKAAMPALSDKYVDHFAQVAEGMALRKGEISIIRLDQIQPTSFGQSLEQQKLVDGIVIPANSDFHKQTFFNSQGDKVLLTRKTDESKNVFYFLMSKYFGLGKYFNPICSFDWTPSNGEYTQLMAEKILGDYKIPLEKDYQEKVTQLKTSGDIYKIMIAEWILGASPRRSQVNTLVNNDSVVLLSPTSIFQHDAVSLPACNIESDLLPFETINWLNSLEDNQLTLLMSLIGLSRNTIQRSLMIKSIIQQSTSELVGNIYQKIASV